MPLQDIPVLPKEHPTYNWADWQSSRDSLVSGTPTSHFAKEAWNAIVDSLNEALENAGLAWDPKYTTASDAKITVAYGALTAQKFNSVRYNIEWPAPLEWAWAERPDFRGYVGRTEFRGRVKYGKTSDRVYPEYIIELVRRLNLLIELMRGTALICDCDTKYIVPLTLSVEAHAKRIVATSTDAITGLDMLAEARSARITHTASNIVSTICTTTETALSTPAPMYSQHLMHSTVEASGASKRAATLEVDSVNVGVHAHSDVLPIPIGKLVDVATRSTVRAINTSTVDSWPVFSIEGGTHVSGSIASAEMQPGNPIDIESQQIFGSDITSSIELTHQISHVLAGSLLETQTVCELDTDGWERPVWYRGGLLIKQAHTIRTLADGSLEVF